MRPLLSFDYHTGLSVSGASSASYRVEFTTDLSMPITWTPLTTITLSNSSGVISNTQPTNDGSSRFYRAVLVP